MDYVFIITVTEDRNASITYTILTTILAGNRGAVTATVIPDSLDRVSTALQGTLTECIYTTLVISRH